MAFTIKQRRFIGRAIETGNPTQAALDVYDTTKRNVASAIASENLRKPNVREAIEEGLASEGLTPGYIFGKLKRVLDKGSEAKVTASDAVSSARTLLKAHEIADRGRMGGSIGMTVQVDGLSKSELIEARQKLTTKWNMILQE